MSAKLPLKAMVLAAGAGTRLRPLTYETPKPMMPIVNRPVLHHVLDNLSRHGVRDVIMNVHMLPEQVIRYCGDGSRWGLSIRYSHEKKLMGTAGAVKKVEKFLKDGPFLIMSGDGVSDVDLTALWEFHRQKRSFATMVTKAVEAKFPFGITLSKPGGRIKGFLEKPSWADFFSNQVNTGIYLFEPSVFKQIPAGFYDFGHDVWPKLLKARKALHAWEWKGYWCDVGSLSEYRNAQHACLDGEVKVQIPGRQLRPGVWVEEGARIASTAELKAPCVIGAESLIGPHAVVGPHTVVGAGCRVGAGAALKSCILFDGVVVGEKAHLVNAIVGAGGVVQSDITAYDAAVLNVRQ
ncbi:MAG: NDP-sugar synthase [Elusimicrobia bacterium]|nr:NDP-sugar synthase [Elusimicrobiota bacterium]